MAACWTREMGTELDIWYLYSLFTFANEVYVIVPVGWLGYLNVFVCEHNLKLWLYLY